MTQGELRLNGGGSSTGDLSNDGLVVFMGGTQDLNSGADWSGSGTYRTTNGVVNVNGTATMNASTIQLQGGMFGGNGLTTASSAFSWTGGHLNGAAPGRLIVSSNGTIANTLVSEVFSGYTLDVDGTLTWTPAATSDVRFNSSSLVIDGTLDIQNNLQLTCNSGGDTCPLTNNGTLRKSAGSGTSAISRFALTNNGATIDIDSGSITMTGTTTLSGSGRVDGGTLTVEGPSARGRWRSDTRVVNTGFSSATATLTYFSAGTVKSVDVTLAAGQTAVLDDVVATSFEMPGTGGAIHITSSSSRLIASARTYDQQPAGSLGQFIPPVASSDGVVLGELPLQMLQVEESVRYRTNLGLAEISGRPARIEISAARPDRKTTATATVDLAANQFMQIGSVLKSMGVETAYNARVSVRVVGGSGSVTAYASSVYNKTGDATYIPAQ